jgi:hypothetical protein
MYVQRSNETKCFIIFLDEISLKHEVKWKISELLKENRKLSLIIITEGEWQIIIPECERKIIIIES